MIGDRHKKYMYDLIVKVVREIGPRESCSENERKLGRLMAEEFRQGCDRVDFEPFECHPKAFLGFMPLTAGLYLASLPFYWVFPPVTFALALAGFLINFFEMLRYREFIDRFFPLAQGENVIGRIRPSGEIKRRVVVSGHMDSAYEFNLWLFLGNASIPVMIAAFAAFLVPTIGGALKSWAMFTGGNPSAAIFQIFGIVSLALYPAVGCLFFWHSHTAVPGAMDNMSACGILAGLARHFKEARSDGGFFPRNTEVVLAAMSSEEAGLRGAMRYVERHKQEMRETPTFGIFLDGLYDEKYLTVTTRELFAGARHSPKLVRLARDIAAKRGWPIRTRMIPMGASDAAAFSRQGVPSTCLLCQDVDKLVPQYHTRYDTPEKIRPESLAVSLQITLDMIEALDREAGAKTG